MSLAVPVHAPRLGDACMTAVVECMEREEISGNAPIVRRFEEAFAGWLGVRHAIAVSSGTTSIRLALETIGLDTGDEVILPSMTFAPCADMIVFSGASPVFVDCDPETLQLDLEAVEAAITPQTRAVMAVHAYGQTADMDALAGLCARHEITLLEDAAQALGTQCRGRAVGTFGKASCYSFYANKLLTTGEGGMVVTDDDAFAERARSLRSHCLVRGGAPYEHSECGFNFRMPSLSAALGLAQIPQLDARLARRQEVADRYRAGLSDLPGLRLLAPSPWTTRHAWWAHVAIFDPARFGMNAETVANALRAQKIDTRGLYTPLHLHPPLRREGLTLPHCERLASTGFVLPSGNALTDQQIDTVITALRALAPKNAGDAANAEVNS